ncbi:MAG TPA: cytochrome P450 [Microthrixaceae bacterium]|nr:cytochrome P450 [Microthrixaceae bacterium]
MEGLPQIDLLNGHLYAADPTPTYRWLRHNAPIYHDDINDLYGVTRYRDIVSVEKQSTRYSNRNAYRPLPMGGHDDTSMISFDDPRHTEQRRLVARKFTPKAVTAHEDTVRGIVTSLIDDIAGEGTCDVVEALAAPLPAMMIAETLGFGFDRWREVKHWSEATIPLGGGVRYLDQSGMDAAVEFAIACSELINERRKDPQHDMVSHWCNSEVDGHAMTDEEIISECLLVVDGGAETTRTVIASTVWDLIEHPDQRQILLDDPAVLRDTAVEEFIRWVTPILNMSRVVTEAHELGGHQLEVGDRMLLMYSSANRDETVFDDPDVYDVRRRHNHHVAFGFGTHFCLGASLARLEIRVMFEELLRRLPDMRLVEGQPPARVPGAFVRGIESVPVEFTPERR